METSDVGLLGDKNNKKGNKAQRVIAFEEFKDENEDDDAVDSKRRQKKEMVFEMNLAS